MTHGGQVRGAATLHLHVNFYTFSASDCPRQKKKKSKSSRNQLSALGGVFDGSSSQGEKMSLFPEGGKKKIPSLAKFLIIAKLLLRKGKAYRQAHNPA